eukprot:TRINITY_DN1233_c0_g1_i1.p1 TRINITY_DN1233_c0_g1~~TRINITY_DN1233_c0_g1_i1.p1  ORF type:complete len:1014 (+),score=209.38 TRINITY_DN1233_c0_g1_i1:110-3151(+)
MEPSRRPLTGVSLGVAFAALLGVALLCADALFAAQTPATSFTVVTTVYLPTSDLPVALEGDARLLSLIPNADRSLMYGIMTGNNLFTFNPDPEDNSITVQIALPSSFGIAGPNFLLGNEWFIFSINFARIAIVPINSDNTFGTPDIKVRELSDGLPTYVDVAFDGQSTFYIGASDKKVYKLTREFIRTAASGTFPSLSNEIDDFGGINTLVIHPTKPQHLFVGSKSGEVVRLNTETLEPSSQVVAVCSGVEIPQDAILVHTPFSHADPTGQATDDKIYIPCSAKDLRTSFPTGAPTNPNDVQDAALVLLNNTATDFVLADSLNLFTINDTAFVASLLRSPVNTNGALPIVQFTSSFMDKEGGFIYIPFDMASDEFYQGCVARVNIVDSSRSVVCLKLIANFAENFQFGTFALPASGRFGLYGASPVSQSSHQVGRLVQINIPDPCTPTCTANGVCEMGSCICKPGFKGESCDLEISVVEQKCSECLGNEGASRCSEDGTCICKDGYKGNLCQIDYCPDDCNGRGTCNFETQSCQCEDNYVGEACAEFFCTVVTSCNSCDYKECGWCESTGECLQGDILGPKGQSCGTWYYRACSTEVLASLGAGYFVTGIFCLLAVINMYSAWAEDTTRDTGKAQVRRSWWRSQRSAKAWVLMELMQFSAITGMIGFEFTSSYVVYTKAFAWTNFWGKNIFSNDDTSATSSKMLAKSLSQYSSEIDTVPEFFFANNLFYVALVAAIAVFVLKIVGFVRDYMFDNEKGDIWLHVHSRIRYILTRIFLMAAPGLCVSAGAQIYYTIDLGGSGTDYFLLVLAIIIAAAIYGSFIFLVVYFKKTSLKEVMSGAFRKKFGCLFEQCHIRKTWYYSMATFGRLVGYFFVGLLQNSAETAIALMIAIRFLYLVQLLFIKPRPYLDPIQFFLDTIRTFLEILTLGLLYMFRSSTVEDNMRLATGLVILLQFLVVVICIVTYCMSWVQGMLNIQSWRQLGDYIKAGFKTEEQRNAKSHAMESLDSEKRIANP